MSDEIQLPIGDLRIEEPQAAENRQINETSNVQVPKEILSEIIYEVERRLPIFSDIEFSRSNANYFIDQCLDLHMQYENYSNVLLKEVKNRIRGCMYDSMCNFDTQNIVRFCEFLEKTLLKSNSIVYNISEIWRRLESIEQGPNETIAHYGYRVKKLASLHAIVNKLQFENKVKDKNIKEELHKYIDSYNIYAKERYIRGLRNTQMKLGFISKQEERSFDDLINLANEIGDHEGEFNGNHQNFLVNNENSHLMFDPERPRYRKICNYCKKFGHVVSECRKRGSTH